MIVLFITLDPQAVDVNVHPAKAEVRFADAHGVHGQVLAVVRQRLLQSDLTPSAALADGRPKLSIDAAALDAARQAGVAESRPTLETSDQFVDYFRRMDPTQKGLVYAQVRREMADHNDEAASAEDAHTPRLTESIRATQRDILQVHDSFIVTQDEQGLVIIDQHALHERMMFQRLLARIRAHGRLESQRLISPVMLDATPARLERLETLQPLLEKIGVEAAPMGPATIGVQAFATLLFDRGVDPAELLEQLLDRAEADGFAPEDEQALHEVLDMMSCKAAIKAGDRLADDELADLLSHRDQIERAASCPHGRPTTIRLTVRDLEKHFKRT